MTELDWLVLSVLLYFALIGAQSVAGNRAYPLSLLLSARDGWTPEDKYLGRARRATANMTEAMIMFTPLAIVAHVTGASSPLTALGGAVFFWSRLAFGAFYIAGVPVLRTVAWAAGVVGIGMIFREVWPFQ